MLKNGITVCLLAYKEAENLRVLLPKIIENLKITNEVFEILVIDTQIPMDDTEEVCKLNNCHYVNQEEPNFGGAFRTGIKYASYDKFLILDSDGSHNPKYIPSIFNMFISENKDVVIGSRYVDGGKTEDAKSSQIMSAILNFVFRTALGFKIRDMSTDYRMYKTEQLKAVELKCDNYDVLEEVLLKLKMNKKKNFEVGEVPISFSKRIYGDSKRRLIPFIIAYIKTLIKLVFIRFPTLKNFILYGFFGVVAFIIDYLMFLLLSSTVLKSHPEISNVISSIIGFLFTFSANIFFNFKKKDRIVLRFVSYGVICIFGTILTTSCIYFLKSKFDLKLLKLILLTSVCFIQFILNKFITYRK